MSGGPALNAAAQVIRKWEPGWRSGVGVDIDFAGHGGEFNSKFGLSGVVMIASSIGGFFQGFPGCWQFSGDRLALAKPR